MTQSQTITIVAKQRMGNKPKSSWKIVTETGEELKAWAADGFKLDVGTSYNIVIDEVVSKNPEYPGSDFFINPKFNKAKGNGEDVPKAAPFKGNGKETDWNEVGIQKQTGEMFAAMWEKGMDPNVLLDECRTIWLAHVIRSKSPTVKMVTKKELTSDDWEEFSAT